MYSEHADLLFLLFVFIFCCFILFICCCFCHYFGCFKYLSVIYIFFFHLYSVCFALKKKKNYLAIYLVVGWGGGGGANFKSGLDTCKPLDQSVHDKLWISSHILFTGEL